MKKHDTLCVHPVDKDNLLQGAVTSPIFPSAAYEYLDTDDLKYPGFYSTFNQERVGAIIAGLEAGQWGLAFSSGMAAISTSILSFARSGDHVIFSRHLYGGTWKFAEQELPKRNISFSYADYTRESFEARITPQTKVIYLETPANPLLNIVPLGEIAALARKKGIVTVVDNTFATPLNQRPLQHGIDISVHSGTKYLGGHNDLPFGALAISDLSLSSSIYETARMYGGSLSPNECYRVERSIKTLSLRMKQHNTNAMRIAEFLAGHSSVETVYYPGLASHEGHDLARRQMDGFGGMLSFELKFPSELITGFLKNLSIIAPALSLGGVESLICAPAVTSHRSLSASGRAALGIKDNLLRLSVGIEDADDLMEDIATSIQKLG